MRLFKVAGPVTLLLILVAVSVSAGDEVKAEDAAKIPEGKQTSLSLYLSSAEAYEMWRQDPESVKILDVRTLEEHIFIGHAAMAINIPFAAQTHEWDEEKKHYTMRPYPQFVAEVSKWAGLDETILVMCRSGGRSAKAVNALAEAGFTRVYSITDGFEGDTVKDPQSVYHGKRMLNGWKNSGLPWTYEVKTEQIRIPESE